ncbi:MAG: hypothetical protein VKK59_06750 [Vampirovibrionales bacterium]|nr:hypothetical protein [Vampirovibrionales bacterium]
MHRLHEWRQKNYWLIATSFAFALLTLPSLLLLWRHLCDSPGVSWSTTFIATAWDARLWPVFDHHLPKWLGDVLVWIAFITAGLCYFFQLKRSSCFHQRTSWLWGLLWISLLVFVVPFDSRDLFGYVNRGVQLGLLKMNPYVHPVAEVANWQHHPLLTDHWLSNPSPYGFAFTALCGGMLWVLTHLKIQALGVLLAFKLLMAMAHIGVSVLVRRLSPPQEADRNFRLVLWHPLLLLQLIANGHNDVLMAFFLLLAITLTANYCVSRPLQANSIWILPALMASILIKWLTAISTPFFLMALWQVPAACRWRLVWRSGLLAFAILGLSMLPFLATFSDIHWQLMANNAGMSQHSIQSSLYRIGYYVAHWFFPSATPWLDLWRQGIKITCLGLYALSLGWLIWYYGRRVRESATYELAWSICAALLGLVLLASGKFHAWYLAVIIPLALTLPRQSQLRQAVIVLSLVQLLAFTPLQNVHVWNGVLMIATPLAAVFLARRPNSSVSQSLPS